jgi:hypothetical protein
VLVEEFEHHLGSMGSWALQRIAMAFKCGRLPFG